jgi:hypothetical protein
MDKREAAVPRVGFRSFLRNAQDQNCGMESRSTAAGVGREAPTESLVELGPELLEQIADFAEEVARGESLDRTLEIARGRAPGAPAETLGVSRVVAELAALRQCIVALWQRSLGADRDDADRRGIVERHGGRIDVETRLGRATRSPSRSRLEDRFVATHG